tara:strand:- start:174 stop:326 length:153 start_codon:yes stop_codon:yes gene_type:complete
MDLSYAKDKRLYKKKVQILCSRVSVDSTGHVFADMKLKGSCSIDDSYREV